MTGRVWGWLIAQAAMAAGKVKAVGYRGYSQPLGCQFKGPTMNVPVDQGDHNYNIVSSSA